MSIQSPVGTLDIKNATLRVGKLEVSNIQGVDTALNVTRSNAILIYDDQASTTTFTGFTSTPGVRDTSNGYLDLADGYVYWGQKLPNSWVMEFEMDIRSGTSAGPLYSNIFSTSNVGGDGYTFTFNDNNDKITLKYDGTTLTEATVSGLFTASENWQKVAINYERGRIAISIGASRKFFYQDIERSTPYVNGEYVNFSSASTDGRKIRNLKITNGTKWTYAGESNVAFQQGSVGIGVTDPAYTLDVGGDINLSGSFYQGGSPFVSSLWTDGANSLYYRSNVEVGTGNLFVDTTTSNVGIRTTTPAYELDVVGNVHADYFLGDGSLLTGLVTKLEDVVDNGNVSSNTIQLTNTDVGLKATGNVEAARFIGDGSHLTGLVTKLEDVVDNGNVSSNTIQLTNTDVGLKATGNVEAARFIGDGSHLTGLVTKLEDVVDNGNVSSNTIQLTNTDVGLKATGNVEAARFIGDGSHLTGLVTDLQSVSDNGNTTSNTIQFTNATTGFVTESNVGIANTNPQNDLDVGSNLSVLDTGSNVLSVTGNVSATSITIGDFQIVSAYGLDHVTNENNQTTDTIISTNATTGFNASSNIVAGGTVQANKIVSTSNLEVGTANLFVDTTTSNVGIGTNTPDYELDVVGNVNATYFIGDGSAISAIQSSNVSDFGSNVSRITNLESSRALKSDLNNNSARITNLSSNLSDNSSRITFLETGNMSISGDKTFTGDIIFESNIHMNGGNVLVANTVNMSVSDPIIELGLNNIGTNDLGIIMTRPAANSNVALVYDESDDILRMGYTLNGASDSIVDLDSNALAVSVQGALSAASVSGDGSGLTSLNASNITTGALSTTTVTIDDYLIHDGDTDTKVGFPLADTFAVNTAGSERLRVDSSGNVGIGTANPGAPLHINDSTDMTTASEVLRLNRGSSGDDINSASRGSIGMYLQDTANPYEVARISWQHDGADTSTEGWGKLGFWTSDTALGGPEERMTIDKSGNVGIGTASPATYLHLSAKNSDPGATEGDFVGTHTLTEYMRFTSTGDSGDVSLVSVGFKLGADDNSTSSPDGRLDICANDGGVAGNGYGSVPDKTIATFLGGGNVGIGTTNPAYTLDVNGSSNASSYYALGQYVVTRKLYNFDLTAQSASNFYPIFFDSSSDVDNYAPPHFFSVSGRGLSGSDTYNDQTVYGYCRGGAQSDHRHFVDVKVKHYDESELRVSSIYKSDPGSFFGFVVYVRGGYLYNVISDALDVYVKTSVFSIGGSTFAIKDENNDDASGGGTSSNIKVITSFANSVGTRGNYGVSDGSTYVGGTPEDDYGYEHPCVHVNSLPKNSMQLRMPNSESVVPTVRNFPYAISGSSIDSPGEQEYVMSTNPWGVTTMVWRNKGTSGGVSGGWSRIRMRCSSARGYVSTIFVQRKSGTSDAAARFYHGCSTANTNNLNGTQVSNPYFHNIGYNTLPQGVWCLSVGFIHEKGATTSHATGNGGIYRLDTMEKISSGTSPEYKFRTDDHQDHRAFFYNNTTSSRYLDFWNPGFYDSDTVVPELGFLQNFSYRLHTENLHVGLWQTKTWYGNIGGVNTNTDVIIFDRSGRGSSNGGEICGEVSVFAHRNGGNQHRAYALIQVNYTHWYGTTWYGSKDVIAEKLNSGVSDIDVINDAGAGTITVRIASTTNTIGQYYIKFDGPRYLP